MLKLLALSSLLAFVAARPGLVAEGPLVYSAPTIAIQEPAYAKVGSVVKSIPTAVSHQSQSVVHSHAHVSEDIVAPVVKSTVVATPVHAPLVRTYAAHAPVLKTVEAAPLVRAYAAHAPVVKTIPATPLVQTYAAHTPVLKTVGATPLLHTYAAHAPVLKTVAASPIIQTYAAAPVLKTIGTPLAHAGYGGSLAVGTPLTYSAYSTGLW